MFCAASILLIATAFASPPAVRPPINCYDCNDAVMEKYRQEAAEEAEAEEAEAEANEQEVESIEQKARDGEDAKKPNPVADRPPLNVLDP